MRKSLRDAAFFLLLVVQGLQALACAICAPADGQNTFLYQLYAADAVVLAAVQPQGAGYVVLAQVKGPAPAGPIGPVQWVFAPVPVAPGAPVVLLYNAATNTWRAVGALGLQRAAWLRRMVAMQPVSVLAETDWPARLLTFVGDLEDAEPLVARTAYEEVSVAPYPAMRSLRPRLVRERMLRWLDDPALAARRPLYLLLAGIVGGADAAADLRARAERAVKDASASALSAALAALVEVEGPSGVAWVEREFFSRPGRDEFQVQAAVVALGVHGSDGARVPRDRIVAAYTRLASGNPAMAGLAASDLAGWGHWELGPTYAQILKSGQSMAFASRYAMVFYLLRSPRADARAAIEALRAAKAL